MKHGINILKILPLLLLFSSLGLQYSCGSSKGSDRIENMAQLQELVNSRDFSIENDWVQPLGSRMINLIDNPNHIRFNGDSVQVFLPYFGVRQTGGGYSRGGEGIQFSGPAQKFRMVEDLNGEKIVMRFEGNQGSENLQFIITLFKNGTSNTAVNSTQRNSISYRGNIKPSSKN